jgi:O-antigen ligase
LALLLVEAGWIITFGLLLTALLGLYLLSHWEAALVALLLTAALLPFGTLPFSVGFTPSLLDTAMGGVLFIYLFQWMRGYRYDLRWTPVSGLIVALILMMLFAFFLGLRGGRPSMNQLRTFLSLLLSLSMALLWVDWVRDVAMLRRLSLAFLLGGALAGLLGIFLWLLPDLTAETLLNRLGRFGYPVGGVIRYREDGVAIGVERAIGTWIDPNAYAGFLLMMGNLAGAQLLSRRPLTYWRVPAWMAFALIGLALFLSDSRGSFLGLVAGLGVIALFRYRQLIWLGGLMGTAALFLPQTQRFIGRLASGFQGADLETQMRLGEYKDALNLIQQHPVVGVGFTGVPYIDLYVAFSSTYLSIAAYAGLIGLALYLLTLGGVLGWGVSWWRRIKQEAELVDIWLGLLGGIIGAMVGGVFDHFYFNPQFQATSFTFWTFIGLFLATTQVAIEKSRKGPV